ncbi:TcfC E-set like domain-containing protein [Endozoicomonas elysicola]|uniref:Pilus assembly protein E-set like domain-containing protein n=1 Tax=Endozoicomonas elysicola TaxID=305900 RepID=A0A081KD00_9GAMM|nr:TcfC E-set like domain-containing protein [Endozoicomonas elysicola]KEI72026.1 hypothetical protein GV64_16010 [Endozoicomonas elysicola]
MPDSALVRIKVAIVISVPLAIVPVVMAESMLAQVNPPQGFESLLKPQQSLVDIYYGGQLLISQMVTYTPEWVELSDPAAVVKVIPNLKDPETVRAALTGQLNNYGDDDCVTSETPGVRDQCDSEKPEIVSMLFSESRFRVTLLINPDFLATQVPAVLRYLPPSDSGWSMMQNVYGVWAGVRGVDDTDEYTLNLMSQLACQENSLHLNASYSNNQRFQIQDAFLRRNYQGQEYSGGIIESVGFGYTFVNNRSFAGVRIASSDQTRVDTDFRNGTPLDIFLPSRGRVEVLREGRLLESWFLEAGNHQLNTSAFPYGAYEIDIIIRSETGQVIQQERRFFAREYQLPPVGEWLYFVETGRVVNRDRPGTLPDRTDQWLTRAGVNRRLTNTLAGNVMVAADGHSQVMEAGAYHLGRFHELVPSLMVSAQGDYGAGISGRLWSDNVSISGSYYRLWRDDTSVLANSGLDSQPTLLGSAFQQTSFSASVSLLSGVLSYRYFHNHYREPVNDADNHGLDYRRSLYRSRDLNVDIRMSLSRSGNNDIALLSFEFLYNRNQWTFNALPQLEYQRNSDGHDRHGRMKVLANWSDRELLDGVIKADLGAETGPGDERYLTRLHVDNRFGGINLNANHTRNRFARTGFYSASFHSSLLANQSAIAVGGERLEDSALVIKVNQQEELGRNKDTSGNAVFDVRVDGYRRGYAVADKPSVVQLPAYHQYQVTLNPAGSSLYELNELERNVTLYPGNVVTLTFEATPLRLWFGRLVLQGEPLAGARIQGGLYQTATDEFGLFQVEAPADRKTLTVELHDGQICYLGLPANQDNAIQQMGTVNLDTVGCKSTD